MWWNVYIALYSKFPAESASERIFKISIRFDKVTAKSLVASFFGTQCIVALSIHDLYRLACCVGLCLAGLDPL